MKMWTAKSRRRNLTVEMSDEVFEKLRTEKTQWMNIAAHEGSEAAATDFIDNCEKIYGEGEYLSVGECIKEVERLESVAKNLLEKSDQEIIDMYPKKTNGTFKRSTRPTIDYLRFGERDDQAYGWYTQKLCMRAKSDTKAIIELVFTIIHY